MQYARQQGGYSLRFIGFLLVLLLAVVVGLVVFAQVEVPASQQPVTKALDASPFLQNQ
jgi:hypothetical protein